MEAQGYCGENPKVSVLLCSGAEADLRGVVVVSLSTGWAVVQHSDACPADTVLASH